MAEHACLTLSFLGELYNCMHPESCMWSLCTIEGVFMHFLIKIYMYNMVLFLWIIEKLSVHHSHSHLVKEKTEWHVYVLQYVPSKTFHLSLGQLIYLKIRFFFVWTCHKAWKLGNTLIILQVSPTHALAKVAGPMHVTFLLVLSQLWVFWLMWALVYDNMAKS